MAEQYAAGATLQEIGDQYGITRERVRQLIGAGGFSMANLKGKSRQARKDRVLRDHGDAISALLGEGDLASEVAVKLGVPFDLVRELDVANPDYARRRRLIRPRTGSLRYSIEEVLQCLREANRTLGGVLTTADYDRFRSSRRFPDGRPWPTNQTASLRYGSWRKALEAAGLESNPSTPITGKFRFSEAECIAAVRAAEAIYGRLPTVEEYDKYTVKMRAAAPGTSTVRQRLGNGSWQATLRRVAEAGDGGR